MQQRLVDSWNHGGTLTWLLRPVSWMYGALVALRKGLYRRGVLRPQRVNVPVIVVGNVVAGGAGKTPAVLAIVRHLLQQGRQVGIVSRIGMRPASWPSWWGAPVAACCWMSTTCTSAP